jgi:hypothetical protein
MKMNMQNFVIAMMGLMLLSAAAFAQDINVTANLSGNSIGNDIKIYSDGYEQYQFNPTDGFTIKIQLSAPADANIHLIQGWDNTVYINPTIAQTNGCSLTQAEIDLDYVCLDVNSDMWGISTPAGDYNIQINRANGTSKIFENQFRVNATTGFLLSTDSINYFANRDQNNVPMNSNGDNFVEITNNSNSHLDIFAKAGPLFGLSDSNYQVRSTDQKWLQYNMAEFANTFTGNVDKLTDLNVGTPVKIYMWTSFRSDLKADLYVGTITFSSALAS